MHLARRQAESADSFLLGAFLPLVAVLLGRRNWFPWGAQRKFPNLFSILVGPSGDRKSSAITLVRDLARKLLASVAFLSEACSCEGLFDEYDEDQGGAPDKILICDDANPLFAIWSNTSYGEIVGKRFLMLHDCCELRESFRRNRERGGDGRSLRVVAETSTNLVLGATPNIALFQGQEEIQSGMPRRFLYYCAEGHGRLIVIPTEAGAEEFKGLVDRMGYLGAMSNVEFKFNTESAAVWDHLQRANRKQLSLATEDGINETHRARLNAQPMHVLKVAMLFQACRWARRKTASPDGFIQADVLRTAAEHVTLCMASAAHLEQLGDRTQIRSDADVMFAKVTNPDDPGRPKTWVWSQDVCVLSKTQLTSRFCHHIRKGTWTPDYLYSKLIPNLILRGKVKEVRYEANKVRYAFQVEK